MEENLVERFEELLESDQNDPEIQYQIFLCYQRGEGVEQNGAEAEKWLRRAAAQGHPEAVRLLDDTSSDAQGPVGEITPDTLPDWCLAAEEGDPEAQYQVGCYFLKDPGSKEEGMHYLEMSAEQGKDEACLTLAQLFLEQGQNERAVQLLRNAADCGLPKASFLLGRCYIEGTGVKKDFAAAEKYLAQGAETGGGETMVEIAARYSTGIGVPYLPVKGLSWLKRAENVGFPNARALYDQRCAQLKQEAEEQRKAEEARRAEEERRAEEARRAEAARRAEENRKAEEAKRAQMQREMAQVTVQGRNLFALGVIASLYWMLKQMDTKFFGHLLSKVIDLFTRIPGVGMMVSIVSLLLFFLFLVSVTLLCFGMQKMQQAQCEWWFGLSRSKAFQLGLLFFCGANIMQYVNDDSGLLVGVLAMAVQALVLFVVNLWIMGKLGVDWGKLFSNIKNL